MILTRSQILALQVLTIGLLAFAFLVFSAIRISFAESTLPGQETVSSSSRADPTFLSTDSSGINNSSGGIAPTASAVESLASTSLTREQFEDTSGSIMNDPSKVTSSSDLESYIRGVLATDTRISDIQTGDSFVSISTETEPALLLGFIHTTIPATLTVNASGTVTISHPHASTLLKPASDDELIADAEAHIQSYIKVGGMSEQTKAQFLGGLQSAIDNLR